MSPTTNLETILLLNKLVHNKNLVPYLTKLKQHDPATYEHSKRVADLSVRIGKLENLSKDMLTVLGAGALLHDIGKLAIDQKILNKPGKLNGREKSEMMKHSQNGFSSLNEILDERVKKIVIDHHEYQKNSYPSKEPQADDEVSELTQIVALVDEYDALTHKRPYKEAMGDKEVMGIIEHQYIGDRKHLNFLKQLLPMAV